jgi:hypothetical protein
MFACLVQPVKGAILVAGMCIKGRQVNRHTELVFYLQMLKHCGHLFPPAMGSGNSERLLYLGSVFRKSGEDQRPFPFLKGLFEHPLSYIAFIKAAVDGDAVRIRLQHTGFVLNDLIVFAPSVQCRLEALFSRVELLR